MAEMEFVTLQSLDLGMSLDLETAVDGSSLAPGVDYLGSEIMSLDPHSWSEQITYLVRVWVSSEYYY